jgi:hypothetical protein
MSSRSMWLIGMTLLAAINLIALATNLSIKARADVAGMDSSDLRGDSDFRHAVQSIVEDCKVDGEDIKC